MWRTLRHQFSLQLTMTIIGLTVIAVGGSIGELIVSHKTFMPHGMCYLWNPELLGLHISADLMIASSYYAIPFMLLKLARAHADLMRGWAYAAFSAFIFWCGTTHLMNIVVIWYPRYWVEGMVKLVTAIVSVAAVISVGWFLKKLNGAGTHEERLLDRLRSGNEMLVTIEEWKRLTEKDLGGL